MPFTQRRQFEFSQTDADGYVGARGYLRTFQDLSACQLGSYDKGEDHIVPEYGICWITSKYSLQLLHRAPINTDFQVETWIEPDRSPVRLHFGLRICDMEGTVYALGQLEYCLMHIEQGRIAKLDEIEFPTDVREHIDVELPKLKKMRFDAQDMAYAYTRTVRYSDLDLNGHMNNLHYVELAMDAFSSSFFNEHPLAQISLEYVGQCREGDDIAVLSRVSEGQAEVLAQATDGSDVLKALLTFES